MAYPAGTAIGSFIWDLSRGHLASFAILPLRFREPTHEHIFSCAYSTTYPFFAPTTSLVKSFTSPTGLLGLASPPPQVPDDERE